MKTEMVLTPEQQAQIERNRQRQETETPLEWATRFGNGAIKIMKVVEDSGLEQETKDYAIGQIREICRLGAMLYDKGMHKIFIESGRFGIVMLEVLFVISHFAERKIEETPEMLVNMQILDEFVEGRKIEDYPKYLAERRAKDAEWLKPEPRLTKEETDKIADIINLEMA